MSSQTQKDFVVENGSQEIAYRAPLVFPKEFERTLADMFDRRYWGILLVSLLVHLMVVAYMATHPPANQVTQEEIEKIQKRFASLVLEQPPPEETVKFAEAPGAVPASESAEAKAVEPEPKKKPSPDKQGSGRRAASAEGRQAERASVSVARRQTREQIKKAVSSQGILGLLTSTSDAAAGSEVEDVLNQGSVTQNLDKALTGVSGLKRGTPGSTDGGGAQSRNVRGSRATGGAGIDDLVEGLGKSEVGGVSRTGDLSVGESGSLLEEEDQTRNQGARDIDAVAAVVKSHNAAIQYCYQRELKRNPNLRGKVVVRFIINPAGHVIEAKIVSSTLNNRRVEQCILNRILRWTDFGAIDPSKGNVAFRQVYSFGY